MTEAESDSIEVNSIVRSIAPLLVGRDPWIIGGVMADLVAIWIVSHRTDDPSDEDDLHQRLLRKHIELVEGLMGINKKLFDAIETAMKQ
jgi:hypothetical protein